MESSNVRISRIRAGSRSRTDGGTGAAGSIDAAGPPRVLMVMILGILHSLVACGEPHRSSLPTMADAGGHAAPAAGSSPTDPTTVEGVHHGMPAPISDATMPDASSPEATSDPRIIDLDGGVRAWVDAGRVEFPGEITLETGWLEVAVCRRSTREHESIVVTDAVPSVVHAALLLAGLEPGAPAAWDEATSSPIPPRGPRVEIEVRFGPSGPDGPGASEVALGSMIEDARERALPTWVFAGSLLRPNPPSMGAGEYFLADYAGTFVGLTTFGDEVIAAEEVRSPETGVDPPVWRIREGAVPPEGTPVIVVVRRVSAAE